MAFSVLGAFGRGQSDSARQSSSAIGVAPPDNGVNSETPPQSRDAWSPADPTTTQVDAAARRVFPADATPPGRAHATARAMRQLPVYDFGKEEEVDSAALYDLAANDAGQENPLGRNLAHENPVYDQAASEAPKKAPNPPPRSSLSGQGEQPYYLTPQKGTGGDEDDNDNYGFPLNPGTPGQYDAGAALAADATYASASVGGSRKAQAAQYEDVEGCVDEYMEVQEAAKGLVAATASEERSASSLPPLQLSFDLPTKRLSDFEISKGRPGDISRAIWRNLQTRFLLGLSVERSETSERTAKLIAATQPSHFYMEENKGKSRECSRTLFLKTNSCFKRNESLLASQNLGICFNELGTGKEARTTMHLIEFSGDGKKPKIVRTYSKLTLYKSNGDSRYCDYLISAEGRRGSQLLVSTCNVAL